MHTIKDLKILAIDPGTKELGIAVLIGSQLAYYAVKTFKQRQVPHAFLAEVSGFIDSLISDYQPTAMAIEKTFLIQRDSALLNVAAAEIKHTGRQCGLLVYEYEPMLVKQKICSETNKPTKRQVADVLTHRFPELAQFLSRPSKWEQLYWAHVFDAVAVGVVCLEEVYGTEAEDVSKLL